MQIKRRCKATTINNNLSIYLYKNLKNWWSYAGSNRGPLECHSSALPAEL